MDSVNELFDLKEQVAIITGASSGLGIEFAEGLALAGAHVVLAARRTDRIEDLAGKLSNNGTKAVAIRCDVTKEDDVENLVRQTMDRFGRLDILVNNAGVSNMAPATKETKEAFQQVMDVNVTGLFSCAQHCGRVMLKARSGSIINIASVMGFLGSGVIPLAAYNASKGAVVNLTRELAAQWASRGVRVNGIAPGWFPTEMTEVLYSDGSGESYVRDRTPMGRSGKAGELTGTLLLLASNAASYITGQTILVDGGWSIW